MSSNVGLDRMSQHRSGQTDLLHFFCLLFPCLEDAIYQQLQGVRTVMIV